MELGNKKLELIFCINHLVHSRHEGAGPCEVRSSLCIKVYICLKSKRILPIQFILYMKQRLLRSSQGRGTFLLLFRWWFKKIPNNHPCFHTSKNCWHIIYCSNNWFFWKSFFGNHNLWMPCSKCSVARIIATNKNCINTYLKPNIVKYFLDTLKLIY